MWAEAGLTLAGGMGGMVLRNQNGVVMHLRSVSRGDVFQSALVYHCFVFRD
jgi:hypothetical protein